MVCALQWPIPQMGTQLPEDVETRGAEADDRKPQRPDGERKRLGLRGKSPRVPPLNSPLPPSAPPLRPQVWLRLVLLRPGLVDVTPRL